MEPGVSELPAEKREEGLEGSVLRAGIGGMGPVGPPGGDLLAAVKPNRFS